MGGMEVDKHGLSARCPACKKAIVYKTGEKLADWHKRFLKFLRAHRRCLAQASSINP